MLFSVNVMGERSSLSELWSYSLLIPAPKSKGYEEKNNKHSFLSQNKVSTFHFELWFVSHSGGGGSGWGQPWLSRVLRSLPPPPEDNHWLLECESVCRISVIYSRGHFSQPLMLFHYHLCCGVNRKIASLWLRLIAGGISWNCCRCKSDITLSNCDLFFLSRCPTLICSSTPKVN